MKQRKRKTKIYSTDNLFVYETGNQTFAIEGVIDNKRIRQRAKTLEEAKTKCHTLEEGKQAENVARTILDANQLRQAERAFELLPAGTSLTDAVNYFLSNSQTGETPIEDAVWKYLETKEHRRPETYKDAKNKLLRFISWAEERKLEKFSRDEAHQFLASVPEGSFNHFLRHCKGLFNWAEREQITETNPFAHIKLRTRQHIDVGVLSCDDANELLEAARGVENGDLLAYTAICLFAGLRPDSEMKHLSWNSVNLEDAEIRVTKGKTQIPRTVEMPTNLLQWLMICDRSKPIYPTNFRGKWAKVRIAAGFKGGNAKSKKQKEAEKGLKPWVKDYTRHSAISYRVRQTGDINTTATWAGNSPAIIRKHYLGLVSGSDAEKFSSIEPLFQKLASGE